MRALSGGPLLVWAALGCAAPPAHHVHERPAPTSAPRPVSTAPLPDASSAAVAPPSPFVARAELPGGISALHAAGDQLLVIQDYPTRHLTERVLIALWKDGALQVDAQSAEQLPQGGRVEAIVGNWPDVRVFVSQQGASSMYGFVFRHSKRGWTREASLPEHYIFRSVASAGARAVALRAPPAVLYPAKPQLLDVTTHGIAPGPVLSRAAPPCDVVVLPYDVVLSRDGRMFVFGRRCIADPSSPHSMHEGAPVVEWYARDQKRGTVVELPAVDGSSDAYQHAAVLSEDAQRIVFSFSGTGRRLSYDGTSFTLGGEQGPKLWRVARTSDGTVWGVTAWNGVVRRKAPAEWVDVPLPKKPDACAERECSVPIAAVGNEVYVAIGAVLYRFEA